MLLTAIGTYTGLLLTCLLTHLALLYHLSVSSAPCISVLGLVILTSYNNNAVCIVISLHVEYHKLGQLRKSVGIWVN